MTAALEVEYFDGVSARPRPVRLAVAGRMLLIEGDGIAFDVPLADVQWPERHRHGPRIAHLRGGGSLHGRNGAAWDDFARAAGLGESLVVRAQQSWRATLGAIATLVSLAVAGYLWGLPLAARGALALLPSSVDRTIGEAVFDSIEPRWLQPSALPAAQRQRHLEAFERAVGRAHAGTERPVFRVEFRAGSIGPNAFALPGGAIVLTDELVALVDGRDDVLIGVLAHELGHVRHRHGMRMLVQATLLGTVTAVAFGDFSSVFAAAPALLGQLAYSRDFEREADAESIRVLRAAGLSPQAMVLFFERVAARRRSGDERAPQLGIALSSHPADAERMARFRDAGR